jgi:imidazolonepropionase-like amidohydrolase
VVAIAGKGGTRPASSSGYYRFQTALLPVLKASGAQFLIGTDAANPMMVAGFSLHEELQVLVEDGGFSRYDVLQFATRNAARFLGDSLGGVVRVGARAELILVDANPMMDLSTLARPRGVLVAGRWLDRARLDSLMARR